MTLLAWVLERALLGACIFAIVQFFLSLAIVFRLLPASFRALHRLLRGLLILSFRFYRLILVRLVGPVGQQLGLDILVGIPRVTTTSLLSLLLGSALLLLIGRNLTGWTLALFLIHGLLVGLTWDEIESPGGIQLGVRIE